MALKRIEYYSQAATGVEMANMGEIANALTKRNRALGVTGWLNFDGRCFFQCLEGEVKTINALYRDILTDPRHHDIVTLTNRPIDARHFQDWSMNFSATGGPDDDLDGLAHEDLARENMPSTGGAGVEDLVTHLSLHDMVVLGGGQASQPSEPIGKRVEAAGRRWLTIRYRTFVKQLSGRPFTVSTELAAAIVENVLLTHRRGPAVLPNLKAFLMRRADLSYVEIGKACRKLRAGAVGRGDVMDRMVAVDLIAAVTAVTFSIRAIAELEPTGLKTPAVRRLLINLCRAALTNQEVEGHSLTGMGGTRNWLESLVG